MSKQLLTGHNMIATQKNKINLLIGDKVVISHIEKVSIFEDEFVQICYLYHTINLICYFFYKNHQKVVLFYPLYLDFCVF